MLNKISFYFLTILLLVTSCFMPVLSSQAADFDQGCTPGSAWVTVNGHSSLYQTFTPQLNRLTRVGVWVEGDGNGNVYLRVRKNGNPITDGIRTEPSGYSLIYFDVDDVEMDVGNSNYDIFMTTDVGNTSLHWRRSPQGSECYDDGRAYLDGSVKDYDWGFATFGYNYTPPNDDDQKQDNNGDDDQSNDQGSTTPNYDEQDGISAGNNLAPLVDIDSSLNVPKLLKAEDVPDDQGGKVKLTWKKINANAGYKIFRSTKADFDSFKNIAKADQDTTEFVDDALKTNQKYYYFIRNYTSSSESGSSNQVEATAIDNLKPDMPKDFKIVQQTDEIIKFTWTANDEDDLIGYRLTFRNKTLLVNNDKPAFEVEIGKRDQEYQLSLADHPELARAKNYRIYLQAEDENGNLSDAARLLGDESNISSNWQKYLLIIILLILVGLLSWYLHKQSKKVEPKIKSKIKTN